jgi:hypothetical protein
MHERHLLVTLKLYGRTQLMIMQTRRDKGGASILQSRAMPCFNATSAYPIGVLGQAHWPASRLVQGAGSPRYKLYNWTASSVQETIDDALGLTGWPMALSGGESAQRVTGITSMCQRWGWTKQFAALNTIVEPTLSSPQKTQND